MPSLCHYDKGQRQAEGRTILKDLEVGWDAFERLNALTNARNKKQQSHKGKMYLPEKIFITGNHEHRIDRATQKDPNLHGVLCMESFKCEKYGWKRIPFLEPYISDRINFSHYFIKQNSPAPFSGKYAANHLLMQKHSSCVVGHSHLKQYAEETLPNGRKIFALVTGCFLDPLQWLDYASQSNRGWWSGVIVMENIIDGYGEIRFISTSMLQEMYGTKAQEEEAQEMRAKALEQNYPMGVIIVKK